MRKGPWKRQLLLTSAGFVWAPVPKRQIIAAKCGLSLALPTRAAHPQKPLSQALFGAFSASSWSSSHARGRWFETSRAHEIVLIKPLPSFDEALMAVA